MGRKLTTKEFVKECSEIHGNKYDYSKVDYINNRIKVLIICPEHGEFWQIPKDHKNGHGCKECGKIATLNCITSSKDVFIEKANLLWNNFYNYSKVDYANSKKKIIITCPIHGDFEQRPNDHLSGYGCKKCGIEKRSTNTTTPFTEFLEKANLKFNNKFSYDETNYKNLLTKIKITCSEHGTFEQTPSGHLDSLFGCPQCGYANGGLLCRKSLEDFVKEASLIHNNRYKYDKVKYTTTDTKVKIICSKHGIFEQTPHSHLSGNGCPICNYSKGELLIYDWLTKNKISFKPQFELITSEIARNSNKMLVDFFVKHNDKQYFIEYDGIQHFEFVLNFHKTIEGLEKQQRRDKVLNDFCELHKDKVTLIRFKYNQSKEEVVKILENIIN